MKLIHQFSKGEILYFFILLFFGVEFINKIQSFFWDADFIIQKAVKIICLAFMLIHIFLNSREKVFWLTTMIAIFVAGQFFLPESFNLLPIVGFGRYFFFLVIVLFFHSLDKITNHESLKIYNLWEKILWLNSTLILFGFLFSLEIFKSYDGHRWGYNGLMMASVNSSYFYISSFIYFLIRYKDSFFKKKIFWYTVISGLFIGTKSVYLGFVILSLIGFYNLNLKTKIKLALTTSLVFVGIIVMYFLFTNDIFSKIVEREGWMSAILSLRNNLFIDVSIPYINENWKAIHYLFGGLSNPFVRPQLELIDLFLYFGIIGSLIFLFIFIKYYFDFTVHRFQIACLLVLLLTPLITGNFFYNASAPIYLIFLKLSIIKNSNKRQIKN